MKQNNFKKILVIFDHAPCHKESSFQSNLKKNKILSVLIPKSMTGILQPADTHWLSVLKKYKI